MKKITFVFALLVGLSTYTFAQRGPAKNIDPEEMAQKRTDKMKEDLGLSAEQYNQVLKLNQEQATKRAAQREQMREEMKAKREAMKKEQDEFHQALASILTPEQIKKHEELMEERREKHHARKPRRRG